MSDIMCRACGEPTEVYTIYNEMEPIERTHFLAGKGCWYCHWGEQCPTCNGTGKRLEFRYIAELGGRRHVPTDEPCGHCNGTGQPTLRDEQYTEALYSLMNSDEDVSVYL